jgi:hypothetical protein
LRGARRSVDRLIEERIKILQNEAFELFDVSAVERLVRLRTGRDCGKVTGGKLNSPTQRRASEASP